MHNHARMYVAALTCNIAKAHWKTPAQWMYYHLLDGDWASNALSWQWVAGANANKKYYANQENINTFFDSNQKDTYLDVGYDEFETLSVPAPLKDTVPFTPEKTLPKPEPIMLDPNRKTLVYNYYNLDPKWYAEEDVQRVLLLEPSFFLKYPVSPKCISFVLGLKENIPGIKLVVAEFAALEKQVSSQFLIYKEHPTNAHYKGREEPRDWMFNVQGYYPSFFAFWKKCKKEMKG